MESAAHNAARWLSRHAALHGARPALVDEERRLDYAALETRCRRAAGLLRSLGVSSGDRVAMLLGNRSAALELVFGAARLGAIVVPLNTRLAPPEVAALLDDCRPRALVHETQLAARVEKACTQAARPPGALLAVGGDPCAWEAGLEAAHEVDPVLPVEPDHPMILMYTSGTTGAPKGALLPHRKTLFNSLNAQIFFELTARDRVGVVVPLFHSFGLKILSIPALYAGACVVLRRRFDPDALWRDVAAERLTVLGGVPTMFRALDEAWQRASTPPDAASLRFLFTAGAAIPVELIHAFEVRGLCLKQGFGQTETSILCCLDVEDAVRKAGSVGKPVFHGEVRIVRPADLEGPPDGWKDCAPGETGEIVVRGPITMLGYWERPDATAETLREGWLRTGDLGSFDEEGFVTLTGRAKDMLISGGENVYPPQVEQVYETHPDVEEIAVVGVPDARWGEVGHAFVVLREGARLDPEALIAWGRERLAAFKVPQRFETVAALPRTVTGKIQKFRLREPAAPGALEEHEPG